MILVLALCLGLLPATALAAEGAAKTIYVKSAVYPSSIGGTPDDNNDGESIEYPVLTFQKALELAGNGGTIVLLNKIIIQSNQFLGDTSSNHLVEVNNVTIRRHENYTSGAMIEITGDNPNYPGHTVTVSLKNTTLEDTDASVSPSDTTEFFHVSAGGKLIVDSGTVLQGSRNCAVVLAKYDELERDLPPAELVMNGGKICGANSSGNYPAAVDMKSGSRFVMNGGEICDNSNSAAFTAVIEIAEGAAFEMKGGSIHSNASPYYTICNDGTMTVAGGTITRNTVGNGIGGGGIYNSQKGTLTMTGGSISDNRASVGGGIYNEGTAKITGGTISGNTSTGRTVGGGGIHNRGTLTIADGKIINNKTNSDNGGGIYNYMGSVDLSGAASVYGNTSESGEPSNLTWSGDDFAPTVSGALDNGAKIGVDPTLTMGTVAAKGKDYTLTQSDLACFSNDFGRNVKLDTENNQIVIAEHVHVWATEWTSDEDGHWHVCTAKGCDGSRNDFCTHSTADIVTKEPTTESEGIKQARCTDCGYVKGTYTIPMRCPVPEDGEGYTIDYKKETITIPDDFYYEVRSGSGGTGGTVRSGKSVTPGATFSIRKFDDTHSVSEWAPLPIPARPVVPASLAAANETVKGKGDGKLTGLTAGMEYSTDGGTTWKSCAEGVTEIEGLGTYQVRLKATDTSFASEIKEFTVQAGPPLTVTFDSQGGSKVAHITDLSYNAVIGEPDDPIKDNLTFVGWYTEPACVTAWDFTERITDNMTLYARWAEKTYSISGTVTDNNSNVANATVKLMQGNQRIASTTTNADGKYAFTAVPSGNYNVVVEKTESGTTKTMTILVPITDKDKDEQNLSLPNGNVNSVLDVKSNTPAVVVGGLDDEAQAVQNSETPSASVTVTMTVEGKKESDSNISAEVTAIKGVATGKTLEYLEIKVEKTVDNNPAEVIASTSAPLTIIIPFDSTGKSDVTVYRYHDRTVDTLTTTAKDGEYMELGAAAITLHVKKFSTYAIGYTESQEPPTPSTPGSGATVYAVTVEQPAHGTVTASRANASSGSTVTLTVTPDNGYVLDTLTVIDSRGNELKLTSKAMESTPL